MNKDNLLQYKLVYFQNDEPIPYKLKCGYEIIISPILVKDWSIFESSIDILKIDKNKMGNLEIIQMSYLTFLKNYIYSVENKSIETQKLLNIFNLSMNEKYISFGENKGKTCLCLLEEDGKIKGFINQKEFDIITSIILHQNLYNYDDREVDSDVMELMQDYYRIKYKNAHNPTLEEQKTYVIAKTGIGMAQINNMTYRTFSQVYSHAVNDVIYIGQKIIQGSYKYKVDEDITHPLYTKEKDKYEELFTSTDVLANKGIQGANKLNFLE